MIYLASPYSHQDPAIRLERYKKAMECCVALMTRDVPVFSPIVHCHEIAQHYNIPTDFFFWEKYCLPFVVKSDSLFVLAIDGWQTSRGVRAEVEYAQANGVPTLLVTLEGYFTGYPTWPE